jgi:hypothetical protein
VGPANITVGPNVCALVEPPEVIDIGVVKFGLIKSRAPSITTVPVAPLVVFTENILVPDGFGTLRTVPFTPAFKINPLSPVTEIVPLTTSLIRFGLETIVVGVEANKKSLGIRPPKAPVAPVGPGTKAEPDIPVGPVFPVEPVRVARPAAPVGPVPPSPVGPVFPVKVAVPEIPVGPGGPGGPITGEG